MDLVIADKTGLEVALLKMPYELDLDVGSTNDYQLTVPLEDWNRAGYQKGYQIFVPGTEYGGKIQNIQTQDNSDTAVLSGDIWRGMLLKKIIEPPKGEDYLIVSGEANQILRQVVGERFGALFSISSQDSGIIIKTYSFDRYTDLLTGLQKMLSTAGARLQITYVRGKPGKPGAVELSAVLVQDLSDSLEYSQDNKVSFLTKDVGNGINHLIYRDFTCNTRKSHVCCRQSIDRSAHISLHTWHFYQSCHRITHKSHQILKRHCAGMSDHINICAFYMADCSRLHTGTGTNLCLTSTGCTCKICTVCNNLPESCRYIHSLDHRVFRHLIFFIISN